MIGGWIVEHLKTVTGHSSWEMNATCGPQKTNTEIPKKNNLPKKKKKKPIIHSIEMVG